MDVAVCFSAEEWAELTGWQKDLYRDVMVENYELVSSLGKVRTGFSLRAAEMPLLSSWEPSSFKACEVGCDHPPLVL